MAKEKSERPAQPVIDQPSERFNPNLEDQDMEIKPVVLGPPGYGSPDPNTSAGVLAAVADHPLKANLSDDYGRDVENVESPALGEEGYDGMTVEELKDLARDRDLEGYSTMNKNELVKAHKAYDKA